MKDPRQVMPCRTALRREDRTPHGPRMAGRFSASCGGPSGPGPTPRVSRGGPRPHGQSALMRRSAFPRSHDRGLLRTHAREGFRGSVRPLAAKQKNGEGGIHSSPFSALPDFLRFLTQCPCLSTTCDRWLALDRSGQIWQKSGPISTVSAQFSGASLERVALSARGFGTAYGAAIVPASAAKGGAS